VAHVADNQMPGVMGKPAERTGTVLPGNPDGFLITQPQDTSPLHRRHSRSRPGVRAGAGTDARA